MSRHRSITASPRSWSRIIRWTLASLLMLGLVVPIAARPRYSGELVLTWWWDVFSSLGGIRSEEIGFALFLLMTPLLGLALLLLEWGVGARARAVTYACLGALPLLFLFWSLFAARRGSDLPFGAFELFSILPSWACLVGILLSQTHPQLSVGHRIAGFGGCVSALLLFLPLAGDILSAGRRKTTPIANLWNALEIPDFGWFVLVIGLVGIAVTALSISLLMDDAGRPLRARITACLIGLQFVLATSLPLVAARSQTREGVFSATLIIVLSTILLRAYAAMGAMFYGIHTLISLALSGRTGRLETGHGAMGHAACCEGLRLDHASFTSGRLTRDDYRQRKVRWLKAAIRDARARDEIDTFLDQVDDLVGDAVLTDSERAQIEKACDVS